jgi:hypothetical protein
MCLYSFLQYNGRNAYFSFSIGYIRLKKKKKQHEMGIFILVIKFNMDALIFVLFFYSIPSYNCMPKKLDMSNLVIHLQEKVCTPYLRSCFTFAAISIFIYVKPYGPYHIMINISTRQTLTWKHET